MLKNKHRLGLMQVLVLLGYYRLQLAMGRIRTLSDADNILRARQLQAKIYLKHGNVNPAQVTPQGVLNKKTDPYVELSTYFGFVRRGHVLCAARVISSMDVQDLQISKGVSLNTKTKSVGYAELSGAVKESGANGLVVPALILHMMKYCESNSLEAYSVVTDQPYRRFKIFMGPFSTEIAKPYKIGHGENIVHPVKIDVNKPEKLPFAYRLLRREVLRPC
ncbi:MAG: hypothetical protein AAF413_01395 [Patescibacteria group bacterium]